jgi:hypothetical protein
MNLNISENVWDEVPTNSQGQEDWSMANNGGNYAFGHRNVLVGGKKVGELQTTSSEFPYCEVTGTFTQTEVVEIRETGQRVHIDRDIYADQYISAQDFINLLN